MLRSLQLALCSLLVTLICTGAELPENPAIWQEYGLVHQDVSHHGKQTVTTYRMKDLTGALAAWQWLRPADARPCTLAPFCTQEANRVVVSDGNYVVSFDGPIPSKPELQSVLDALPDKRNSSLPAILTFLPTGSRVPNSGRYILGPNSLAAFAPELANANPGFDQGAEGQAATYQFASGAPLQLAVFYYATPEMARLHTVAFKSAVGPHVKRSGVLVAVVFGAASETAAETLLSRIQYEAKITWNETPPPSPIKPLYRLLKDILYISGLLSVLSLSAGLVYAGMRIYRRRYGTLDSQEAMTTLNLGGD